MEDIKVVHQRKSTPTEVDLSSKPQAKQKVYEAPKAKLSNTIQRFDKKVKVHTEDPYKYNSVSLAPKAVLTPTASTLVANPLYNAVGKALGVDNSSEWGQFYDKVYAIAEWAQTKTKSNKIGDILAFIEKKSRSIPSMGARRINDIFIHTKLSK